MEIRSRGTIRTATACVTGYDANDPAFRSVRSAKRWRPVSPGTPPEHARDFVGLTSVELCRELLRTSGLSTMGSPGVIVERAMTTSDLPASWATLSPVNEARLSGRPERVETRCAATDRERLPHDA